MAGIYHPTRGGNRGGKDQFNWDDVKTDKERENYLGHSVMVPTGKWQEGKDLVWYTRNKKELSEREKQKKQELKVAKDLEARAMAAALGHNSFTTGATSLTAKELQEVLSRGQTEHEQGDRIQGIGHKKSTKTKMAKSGMTFAGFDGLVRNNDEDSDDVENERSKKKKAKKEKKKKKKKKKTKSSSESESDSDIEVTSSRKTRHRHDSHKEYDDRKYSRTYEKSNMKDSRRHRDDNRHEDRHRRDRDHSDERRGRDGKNYKTHHVREEITYKREEIRHRNRSRSRSVERQSSRRTPSKGHFINRRSRSRTPERQRQSKIREYKSEQHKGRRRHDS